MPLVPPEIVQTKTGMATGTSISVTLDDAPTEGNRLFVAANGAATASMVSAGFTLAASPIDFTALYLWYKTIGPGQSATITVAPSTSAQIAVWVAEVSGLDDVPMDVFATSASNGNGTTAIPSGTTDELAQANEFIIAAFGVNRGNSGGTSTITAYSDGFTESAQIPVVGGDSPLLAVATKTIDDSADPVTCTATLSTGENHPVALIATFKGPPVIEMSIRLSGGSGNADPRASIGGAESSTEVDTALLDTISRSEADDGFTDYRIVYIHNDDAERSAAVVAWISDQLGDEPGSPDLELAIGVCTEDAGETVAALANDTTAPDGVEFSSPTSIGDAIDLGEIGPGDGRGLTIRRTADEGAAAAASNPWQIMLAVTAEV